MTFYPFILLVALCIKIHYQVFWYAWTKSTDRWEMKNIFFSSYFSMK